jgi:hypothetical protein
MIWNNKKPTTYYRALSRQIKMIFTCKPLFTGKTSWFLAQKVRFLACVSEKFLSCKECQLVLGCTSGLLLAKLD